jgi:predicted RecB family nuclease
MTDKFKAHIQYKLQDGKTRVPGVTTITGELGWNTRVLVNWANRIGLEGIEAAKYTDDKADIGTLAHRFVTDTLQGKKTNTDDYSKNQIAQAENSVLSFHSWYKEHKLEPILIEKPLVSEIYRFGGTADIYGTVDGIPTLIDLKTGKGIYDEYLIQTGGYSVLLKEHGHPVEKIIILNIPRAASEKFKVEDSANIAICEKIFLNCLANYQLKKQIKNNDFYQFTKEASKK